MSVTKTNHPIPDGRLFVVGAATGGDRVSASGKDGRTPAMRRLFAKWAHCKWHNIAPPERRRIGSTCARVPKVSSRNRGCPFRGYGCGENPQEGGTIFRCFGRRAARTSLQKTQFNSQKRPKNAVLRQLYEGERTFSGCCGRKKGVLSCARERTCVYG